MGQPNASQEPRKWNDYPPCPGCREKSPPHSQEECERRQQVRRDALAKLSAQREGPPENADLATRVREDLEGISPEWSYHYGYNNAGSPTGMLTAGGVRVELLVADAYLAAHAPQHLRDLLAENDHLRVALATRRDQVSTQTREIDRLRAMVRELGGTP